MKKNLTKEEKENRRSNIKGAIVFILIVGTIAPLVWFAREYFAEESLVDYRTTEINGDTLSVILTEKTSSTSHTRTRATDHHDIESKNSHYGYFLELYDSAANKSLDKIEFDSPVWAIQETPRLSVFPDGTIWMISTNIMQERDEPGFILKFKIENNKIIRHDFSIDEKYHITGIDNNCVILSDGNGFGGTIIDRVFGCTYLDLETGKIVVLKPYSFEDETPVNPDDYLP